MSLALDSDTLYPELHESPNIINMTRLVFLQSTYFGLTNFFSGVLFKCT